MSIPNIEFNSALAGELKAIKQENLGSLNKPMRSKSLMRNVMDIQTEHSIVSDHSDVHAEIETIVHETGFLFRNNDPIKLRWDFLIMLLAVFNCFTIPVNVAFQPALMNSTGFEILNHLIDFVFFSDILITFRTVITSDTGDEITSTK
jgi:hypothetical protein